MVPEQKQHLDAIVAEQCKVCRTITKLIVGKLSKPPLSSSNSKIREYYNGFLSYFLDKGWKGENGLEQDTRLSLADKAYIAYNVRHQARLEARQYMNVKDRTLVEARDFKTYGNREGPTFEWLVAKKLAKIKGEVNQQNLDQLYEEIINSSTKTNRKVNFFVSIYDLMNTGLVTGVIANIGTMGWESSHSLGNAVDKLWNKIKNIIHLTNSVVDVNPRERPSI